MSKDFQIKINYLKLVTETDKNAIEQSLKQNDHVITKADKSGETIIVDIKDYTAKANEQLQDNSLYQKPNRCYCQTFQNCQQSYKKLQKKRTIITLNSKQTHRR